MAVTGIVHPDRIVRNVGARPGDALVLTKPLGTGIITTAVKRQGPAGRQASLDAAIQSMIALNAAAARVMRGFAVHACSDVTGFSLLGHSQEMAGGSGVTIEIAAAALPLLEGAPELAEGGNLTGGCTRNRAYLQDKVAVDPALRPGIVEVAFDPQTSGGLLIALPAADAPRLVTDLKAAGVTAAAIVGRVVDRQDVAVRFSP
jgi:selenide,water dikinase